MRCGNDPRVRLEPGDLAVVEAFRAYLVWAKVRDEQGAEAAGPEPLAPDGAPWERVQTAAADE